jgi:nucleotide-binding universal stress UspA family protein
MSKLIVVPLDGSAFAESALPAALSLAKRWSARIHLVTVEEVVAPIPPVHLDAATTRWVGEYLADVRTRIHDEAGFEAEVSIGAGAVSPAIEEVVADLDADLVAMSTHGHGLMSRAWLGSVADELVRHCDVPILLVRPQTEEAPDLTAEVPLSRVMIPLDGSELAEGALQAATSIGRAWNARFTLVRLVRYPQEAISAYLPDSVRMAEEIVREGTLAAEEYLSGVEARLLEDGLEVEHRVKVVNSVARGILKLAQEEETELVALASHGHGGLRRALLGSVADKVVRGAEQPVLVVRAR